MALTEKRLDEVLEECKRFEERAKEVRRLILKGKGLLIWAGCRETGACRRASLDLSRALADLRRVE